MSAFRFRLQRVLELRERVEQTAAARLAAARDEADAAGRALESLHALRAAGVGEIAAAHGARTAGQMQNLTFLIDRLDGRLEAARGASAAADAAVREREGEFTAAFQERRVLDRLRERREEEWRAETGGEDRRRMDEIALSRFVRKPGPGSAEGDAEGVRR
jgi:flagellar protein FliJ